MYNYAVAPILYRGVRVSILQTRPRYIMAATTVNTETCIPLAQNQKMATRWQKSERRLS